MRISKKCEYALRALFVIARMGEGQQFQIHDLSRREGIPVKFLEQILLSLRHAGILSSKRGVGGGYQLRRSPGEITIGEVIRLMDGPLPTPEVEAASTASSRADRGGLLPFQILMRDLQTEIATLIDSRTIEDVLLQVPEAASLSFEI